MSDDCWSTRTDRYGCTWRLDQKETWVMDNLTFGAPVALDQETRRHFHRHFGYKNPRALDNVVKQLVDRNLVCSRGPAVVLASGVS